MITPLISHMNKGRVTITVYLMTCELSESITSYTCPILYMYIYAWELGVINMPAILYGVYSHNCKVLY